MANIVKVFSPKPVDIDKFLNELDDVVLTQATHAKGKLEEPFADSSRDPDLDIEEQAIGNYLVGPSEIDQGHDSDPSVWGYLEGGTSVRYAKLGSGYTRMTNPGSFNSSPGNRPVVVRGHKAGANPGIKERAWRQTYIDEFENEYYRAVLEVVRKVD